MSSNLALFTPEDYDPTGLGPARGAHADLQLYKVRYEGEPSAARPGAEYVLAPSLDDALERFGKEAGGRVPFAVELVDKVTIESLERPQCFKFLIDGVTHVVIGADMTRAWTHLRNNGLARSRHWQIEIVRLSDRVVA